MKYANPRLDCVAQSLINANLTLIGGLNLIHLRRKIKSLISRLILKYWNKMVNLLFGLACVRQRRARIYRYNDSILIYNNKASHSLQIWQSLNWIQYKPQNGGFTEENELLLRSETNRPSADSTTILCECWLTASGLLQVVGDTTGVDKSIVSLAVHNADATLETITVLTYGKLHYGILIVV